MAVAKVIPKHSLKSLVYSQQCLVDFNRRIPRFRDPTLYQQPGRGNVRRAHLRSNRSNKRKLSLIEEFEKTMKKMRAPRKRTRS